MPQWPGHVLHSRALEHLREVELFARLLRDEPHGPDVSGAAALALTPPPGVAFWSRESFPGFQASMAELELLVASASEVGCC
jgi:hypothetical protein